MVTDDSDSSGKIGVRFTFQSPRFSLFILFFFFFWFEITSDFVRIRVIIPSFFQI